MTRLDCLLASIELAQYSLSKDALVSLVLIRRQRISAIANDDAVIFHDNLLFHCFIQRTSLYSLNDNFQINKKFSLIQIQNFSRLVRGTLLMQNDCNPLARPYFNYVRQSHLACTRIEINSLGPPLSFSSIFRPRSENRAFDRAPPIERAGRDRKCMRVYFARASDADRMQNNGSLPDICGRDCDKYIR